MNWEDLKYLHHVAQQGSFLGAGKAMGTTTSTVSRRIAQLEQALGFTLVKRHNEGIKLTEKGKEYAILAETLSGLIMEEHERKSTVRCKPAGNIVFHAHSSMYEPLTQMSCEFLKHYPECTIELNTFDDPIDITRGEADIAIRNKVAGETSLIYKKIGEAELGFFASREYLESFDSELTPQNADYIGALDGIYDASIQKVVKEAGFTEPHFRTDFYRSMIYAVHHGLGVALLKKSASIDLVEIFPEISLPAIPSYLVTRPQALKQPHIRAFADFIYEVTYRLRDFIRGGPAACSPELLIELGMGHLLPEESRRAS